MIDVVKGPAAVRYDSGWLGVASGNRYARHKRKTSQKALCDARRLERYGGPDVVEINRPGEYGLGGPELIVALADGQSYDVTITLAVEQEVTRGA